MDNLLNPGGRTVIALAVDACRSVALDISSADGGHFLSSM
ncbi:hypothetical protein BV95_00057 [Sphingobium chlorophenolicum]|uniref:Uncharacterized protein n=1 Tax=Sphingobium chlorophenolicum TaxID=46429 RepID=A0A081RJP8_SPHCR|nr:hypothetical protein BV95_00057 [Sphingobium chlorophenolicum]